ncbi:hypothetical protein DFH09DRAFT_1171862 [Mycena vulgaris]|nr:hypothetical protein DFH09DRAFT_1171862 [Mycena vulgaris]
MQFDEDPARLPEGIKRIGYDADTAQYTFCDREGNIYVGPPNEEYGLLTPVGTRGDSASNSRPQAFASENSNLVLSVDVQPSGSGQTFHDILPAHLITSPSSAESRLSASSGAADTSAGARFRDAVRRTAVPSLQNVVKKLNRSATAVNKAQDDERDGLLGDGPQPSSELAQASTAATTSTARRNSGKDGKPRGWRGYIP